jgi:hypothetical protein
MHGRNSEFWAGFVEHHVAIIVVFAPDNFDRNSLLFTFASYS